ncbi:disease resistance protein SUMM2-like [Phaseolus vulgaris]|uniref:disease resistance protein SUMM2-like n=1 Tax=Phaseolus vulgaris TaxID=3885 RepID=UPI0035C9B4FD
MEDFFLSIATKIVEYAVSPILDHAKYLCCFHNFALNLSNDKEQLELTRDSVKKKISEATNRIEKVEPPVEKWLKDVEKVLHEVRLLEERILNVNKSYLRRKCQYSLAKEIERKTTKMIQLNRDSKFEPFSTIIELPGMKYYSSNGFFMFKSTEASYNKLLEILKNKSVSMIGLVGLGGSGKTTLAKEVGKKAEEMKLFHKVVITTVSQPLDIKRIRNEIILQLGLDLKEELDIGRAQRLSQRLRKDTTLLILDDVWEKLNFEDLGIPFDESYKACCILITSRSKEVCTSMQCQSIIELNLLSDKEAWTLFTHYANITDVSSEALKGVARKIINECKGLPIAIVTVGSTLKGKTIEDFELALSRLENSKPLNIPKGLTSPYACLELSYTNLNNQLAQSLLLLCSMFPEDYEIDLEDLFRFGRGFRTVGTFGTMENARREMHEAINILKTCFLLVQAGTKENVKMHDLVRDVALWIASKSGQSIFTGTEVDPSVLEDDEFMKDMQAIALWNNVTKNGFLDYRINCPNLEILLLYSKGRIKVSDMAPQSWEKIKTLSIKSLNKDNKDLSLPESLKLLKNLRTLCLRGHYLGDISFVERLQALEILDLRYSNFEKLPVGIVELKKLKILDLYRCRIKERNVEPYKVVEKCLQLEELYLHLRNLENYFPHDVSFSKLQRYVIKNIFSVFDDTTIMKKYAQSRSLLIDKFDVAAQNFISLPIKDLFMRAEFLHLENLRGDYKNIIPSMDPQGMNHLTALELRLCKRIECLVDNTSNTNNNIDFLQPKFVFLKLVYLRLERLWNLEEVFCDPSSRCSLENLEEFLIQGCSNLKSISFPRKSKLCNLKVLSISSCPMLTSLFVPSVVQSLVLLEELRISRCSTLRHIIEEVEEGNNVLSSTPSHSYLTLQKLKILCIEKCNNLEYIFSVFLAVRLVSLEYVSIDSNMRLKYAFGSEKERNNAVYPSFQQTDTKFFSNLDSLYLRELPNLIDIWPEYCRPHLPNLKSLECSDCPKLLGSIFEMVTASNLQQKTTLMENEISCFITNTFNQLEWFWLCDVRVKGLFQIQMGEEGGSGELLPLNLDITYLYLENLPELNFIWKGPTGFLSLQKLHFVNIYGCPKLKTIFSITVVTSLPMLENLYIDNCDELEQIFDLGDAQQLQTLYSSQQPCFPTLSSIQVEKCNKLKCLFYNLSASHFTSLETLKIEECSQLHKAFGFEQEADDGGGEETGKNGEQVLLQELTLITLKNLPNFEDIHHGFKLKGNGEHIIEECPKYSPSLHLDPGKIHMSFF